MLAREPARGPAKRRTTTSRRTFLELAGSFGVLGLAGSAATGERQRGDVSIGASPALGDAVRGAADRFRGAAPDADVSIEDVPTTEGLDRVGAGEIDGLVAARPLLPAERARATEHRGVERRELPVATATLQRPESSWLDPLRPDELVARWSGDGPVETWAEVAPASTDRGETRRAASAGRVTDFESPTTADATIQPADCSTPLVRGVRAPQYASGFGGVAYYEPDADWLEADALGTAGPAAGDDATVATPVVRLGYLHAAETSLRREAVADFVRTLAGLSRERVGDLTYYADPFGVT